MTLHMEQFHTDNTSDSEPEDLGADMEIKSRTVHSGGRKSVFRGVKLASVTSERPGAARWTEITLYRTEGMRYVVHRVGVSAIAHRVNCPTLVTKNLPVPDRIQPDEFALKDRSPCHVCRPNIMKEYSEDPLSIRVEVNRHWMAVIEGGPQVIEALHTSKDGVRSLSSIAATLIREATENDPVIAAAYEGLSEIE